MNCNGDHRANSERCPVIKTQKEINQIMAHRNVGFFEARKIVEKWSSPAFPVGAGSHRGYAELNLRNFPVLKTPSRRKEWDIFESREYNKVPNQTIGWNPERRQWKMNTDNSRTQITDPGLNKNEQRNCSKGQNAIEKSLDELEVIEMEDDVKNVLVTIINLVINSGDSKAMVKHLWKAIELHEHLNGSQSVPTN